MDYYGDDVFCFFAFGGETFLHGGTSSANANNNLGILSAVLFHEESATTVPQYTLVDTSAIDLTIPIKKDSYFMHQRFRHELAIPLSGGKVLR
jgi:hypothetical protein